MEASERLTRIQATFQVGAPKVATAFRASREVAARERLADRPLVPARTRLGLEGDKEGLVDVEVAAVKEGNPGAPASRSWPMSPA